MKVFEKIINQHQTVFQGTLYTIKKKGYPPWQPSGIEGRYNGSGTSAYYFGDSPITCSREKQNANPDANLQDYELFALPINNGTFVDLGAVEGTRFIQHKKYGGWLPTQELSSYFNNRNILGFRYASQACIQQGYGGTCFCIYESRLELSENDFQKLDIHEFLQM